MRRIPFQTAAVCIGILLLSQSSLAEVLPEEDAASGYIVEWNEEDIPSAAIQENDADILSADDFSDAFADDFSEDPVKGLTDTDYAQALANAPAVTNIWFSTLNKAIDDDNWTVPTDVVKEIFADTELEIYTEEGIYYLPMNGSTQAQDEYGRTFTITLTRWVSGFSDDVPVTIGEYLDPGEYYAHVLYNGETYRNSSFIVPATDRWFSSVKKALPGEEFTLSGGETALLTCNLSDDRSYRINVLSGGEVYWDNDMQLTAYYDDKEGKKRSERYHGSFVNRTDHKDCCIAVSYYGSGSRTFSGKVIPKKTLKSITLENVTIPDTVSRYDEIPFKATVTYQSGDSVPWNFFMPYGGVDKNCNYVLAVGTDNGEEISVYAMDENGKKTDFPFTIEEVFEETRSYLAIRNLKPGTYTLKAYAAEYDADTNTLTDLATATAVFTVTSSQTPTPTPVPTATPTPAPNKITTTSSAYTKTASSSKAQTFSLGVKRLGNGKITYTSSAKGITVKSGKVTIAKNYSGKATITIKVAATSAYKAAAKKVTVTVNPQKTSLSSVTSPKTKTLQAAWKKNTTCTGYQLQYSLDNKFTKQVKQVSITKNSVLKKVISKLTKGKTYYVRIRAYKKESGKYYYSSWSTVKKVKIK